LGTFALTALLYVIVPKGFFPVQDTGQIQVIVDAPQSSSYAAMAQRQEQVANVILGHKAVESLSSFIGVDGTNATLNSGRMLVNLKPHGERDNVQKVIRGLQKNLAHLAGVQVYMQPVQDITIEDRISRTQYQMSVQDPDPAELAEWVPKLVGRMKTLPELADVASDLQWLAGLRQRQPRCGRAAGCDHGRGG
jgi:multidrug efflux pump